jgi:hypothetical protein
VYEALSYAAPRRLAGDALPPHREGGGGGRPTVETAASATVRTDGAESRRRRSAFAGGPGAGCALSAVSRPSAAGKSSFRPHTLVA